MTETWTDESLARYLERLASAEPTPGGGSAAALSGALASALGSMVIAVAEAKAPTDERRALAAALVDARQAFLTLAEDDEAAFAVVMDALRLPKDNPTRAGRLQQALLRAADVPLAAADAALAVLRLLRAAEPHASRAIVSDLGVAAHLALASLDASLLNIRVNQRGLADSAQRDRLAGKAESLRSAAVAEHEALVRRVAERLAA